MSLRRKTYAEAGRRIFPTYCASFRGWWWRGSIDFAYAIHTEVGNQCVGAKVNARIVPLKYNLKNGDVVDILTQQGHLPSKDWLSIAKTSKARNKIKAVINTTERAKAVEIGEKYLEKEARRFGVQWKKVNREQLQAVASEYGFPKMEDLHAALGYGKFSARQVLIKLAPEQVEASERSTAPAEPATPAVPQPDRGGDKDLVIRVKGIDDVMVYRAKCCNPIRGEQIVGYITRGKGVAVHSVNCTNVQNLMYEVERKIAVEWVRATEDTFAVRLTAYADDRPGILSHLTSVVFQEGSNIKALEAQPDEQRGDGSAIINVLLDVRDKKQLERVVAAVRRISGIRDVERVN